MKNKKMISLFLAFIVVISFFSISVYKRSRSFDYDNSIPVSQVFDKPYTKAQISILEKSILPSNLLSNDINFSFFNIVYKPTVIRKTTQGYYAIFADKDKSLCFVFWTFENEVFSIYRTNGFVPSELFCKSINIGETTLDDMKESGLDFFGYPSSKMFATAHICTDGVVVVEYDSNFIVMSVDVYTNQEMVASDDYLIDVIPYILPKDRA